MSQIESLPSSNMKPSQAMSLTLGGLAVSSSAAMLTFDIIFAITLPQTAPPVIPPRPVGVGVIPRLSSLAVDVRGYAHRLWPSRTSTIPSSSTSRPPVTNADDDESSGSDSDDSEEERRPIGIPAGQKAGSQLSATRRRNVLASFSDI